LSGIHQFVPMLHQRDAVGQHTQAIQTCLRKEGVDSEIYVEWEDPETASLTRSASTYPGRAERGDVLVYQLATASDLATWLAARPERLVVNSHNVTPPEQFGRWDNALARHQLKAQQQLAMLAGHAVLGVGVSEVNRADLVRLGYPATAVVPPIVALNEVRDPGRPRPAGEKGARWLAIGRLAPNKAFEDIIAALFVYRSSDDLDATLLIVGRVALANYADALRRYAISLGLSEAVTFAGALSDDELARAYRDADVLVVTSRHEGFGLPVVEAMAHDLPVIAYRQGAVPEVLGQGGVLVESTDPLTICAAVRRLGHDPAERSALIAAGRAQLSSLQLDTAGTRMVELLRAAAEDRLSSHPAVSFAPGG
jgi:glycosyltransferase involved in cell wall biosynthesis